MLDLKKVMVPNVAVVANSREEWTRLMIAAEKAGLTWEEYVNPPKALLGMLGGWRGS